MFGSKRLFPGDKEYEPFKIVWPRDHSRFEIPYVGPFAPSAPYTNVGTPLVL